jgi:Family of unknown function (DUF6029)
MKKNNCTLSILIITLISFNNLLVAQTGMRLNIMPEGLGFSNQLEYSYDVDLKREILENWMNLDYSKGIFSAGLRYDIFQPNDPDPSISRGKEKYAKIDFVYFQASIGTPLERLDILVGNYYALTGRGMVLKSYEDRNIRIDNNLLGLKVIGKYAGFILTTLSGMPENSQADRKDILHLADLEYRNIRWLKIGGTYASNLPPTDGLARTDMASLRLLPSFWNVDIYTEYGVKMNSDIQRNAFNNSESIIGRGFYGNLNFYFGSLSLLGEYKYYDNYSFTTQDGTVNYNTPPSIRIEYAYMLPNRHPSPLDPNNEEGYQIAAGYSFDLETYFNAAYTITKTLPASSYFQRINETNVSVLTQLEEFYLQAQRDWSSAFTTIAAFSYNEELSTNTKNLTPILEFRYYFKEVNTIKLIFEHQHSTNKQTEEQHFTDVLSLEYLRSPRFNVALVAELETREPKPGNIVRKFWGFVQFGYKLGYHTDISLLVGTRQAGNICIGGVCRFEPEFRGVELKLLTRL